MRRLIYFAQWGLMQQYLSIAREQFEGYIGKFMVLWGGKVD